MQIALFNLMSLNHPGERPEGVLRATVDLVRLAEDLGFDAAWFAEHHFSSFGMCASPLMMAMHCAAVTRRIKLGPAVLVLPLYQPLRMLEEIGMLDALSDGRAIIGIGTGHQPHEFRSLGVPLEERHARALEAWDILEMGLAARHVDYSGRHYKIPPTDLFVGLMDGRKPELFVATHDPAMLDRAVRSGVTPFISQGYRDVATAVTMRAGVEAAYRRAGGAADPVPLAVQRYAFVTRDADEARAAAEGLLHLARKTLSLRDQQPPRDGLHLRSVAFRDEPSVEWLLENALVGDPARCAERLIADIEALRPAHMSLYMGFTGLEAPRVRRSVELFGREVLPVLRRYLAGRAAPQPAAVTSR